MMTYDVLAFWQLLERDPSVREQALLAGQMECPRSAAAYLAGLAGGHGYRFTCDDYLSAVRSLVVRTEIGPVRATPGPHVPAALCLRAG